jgi:hypothetical protein
MTLINMEPSKALDLLLISEHKYAIHTKILKPRYLELLHAPLIMRVPQFLCHI